MDDRTDRIDVSEAGSAGTDPTTGDVARETFESEGAGVTAGGASAGSTDDGIGGGGGTGDLLEDDTKKTARFFDLDEDASPAQARPGADSALDPGTPADVPEDPDAGATFRS